MNLDQMNLADLKLDIIKRAERGYPIMLAGAVYWVVMAILNNFIVDEKTLTLIYIFGMGSIFPLGIILSQVLKVDFFAKGNQLGVVGGIVGGTQAFHIPIYIFIYMQHPEWVPFFIGILGGSHFLPYAWIYNSKAYYFHTFAMVGISVIVGFGFKDITYTIFPLLMAAIYLITTLFLKNENKAIKLEGNFSKEI